MTSLVAKLDHVLYPTYARNGDDPLFRERILQPLTPSNTAAASGLTVERLDRIEGRPEVLRMTWPTDRLGAAYERRVNAWDGLALFRVLRVGELRKG